MAFFEGLVDEVFKIKKTPGVLFKVKLSGRVLKAFMHNKEVRAFK
jgi:hypothetical protein